MATGTSTAGEQLIHIPTGNVKAMVPVGGYSSPNYGDLVIYDTSGNNSVDRCASGEEPAGIVVSDNNDNGILSVALFKSGTRVVLPYTGSLAVGDKIDANATKNTATGKDVVKVDNSNGVGKVIAVDVPATGFCVVEF